MSLNGLDAPEINEAYQSALGEGGGWILLKYTSRDHVALLKKGTGGVVEVREAVGQCEELSPLYGFVLYRRRKVVLKYVPEGTSRLLQGINLARVTVQFSSVIERFTPHDTIFSFTAAHGLSEAALSAACSLHTASASIKSSNDSLRQRGLSEIVEDVDENQTSAIQLEHAKKSQEDSVHEESGHVRPRRSDSLSGAFNRPTSSSPGKEGSPSPSRTIRNTDKALPPTPLNLKEERPTSRSVLEEDISEKRDSVDSRPSFQSTRPFTKSVRTSYEYKPKMRTGARPSIESTARGHSYDNANENQPVSTLPSTIRIASRKPVPIRPKSGHGRPQQSDPPKPSEPVPGPSLENKTSAQIISNPPSAFSRSLQTPEAKTASMTPEKRRLKKALELRQKQIAARNNAQGLKTQPTSSKESYSASDAAKRHSLTATLPDVSTTEENSDILQERIHEFGEDTDIVRVGIDDLGKGAPDTFEASPISIPEVSDGTSTQASSVTDEEETPVAAKAQNESSFIKQDPELKRLEGNTQENNPVKSSKGTSKQSHASKSKEDTGEEESREQRGNEIKNETRIAKGQIRYPTEDDECDTASISELRATEVERSSLPTNPVSISQPESGSTENSNPSEIPLPPINENEATGLIPQRTMSQRTIDKPPKTKRHDSSDSQLAIDLRATVEERPSTADTVGDRKVRRQGLVNPIKRVSSPDFSDEYFTVDDLFIEELQTATVLEAKPISVSKSPITPVFSKPFQEPKSTENLRPSSSSNRPNKLKRNDEPQMMPKLPDLLSARSVSASSAPLQEAQLSPPMLKKVGVSSGISQRIKALEQLSSRPTSPSSQLSSPVTSSSVSPASPSVRKTSFRATQAAAEIAKASAASPKYRPKMPSPLPSPCEDRPNPFIGNPVHVDVPKESDGSRPESISVTARIVRGTRNKVPELPLNPAEPQRVELYASPLTVEHQSMRSKSPPSPLKPPRPKYARSMSSASSDPKTDPLPAARRDSISSRLSSSPSLRSGEFELPRSMSDSSIHRLGSVEGAREEKKESRKSRLLKRMSNISSASRRSIVSALSPVRKDIKEEPIVEHHELVEEQQQQQRRPSAVEVGDVNIQFPDTLLWKRRHMQIDGQGNLVLSASKSDNNSKVLTKRYPFTDFYAPYAPDHDRQELPNSVVFDFKDGGSTLQCACESTYSQAEVLR
ncbi:MAG: hypothetical protein Q9190_006615, partial [Brigantiaea leucoxantha]